MRYLVWVCSVVLVAAILAGLAGCGADSDSNDAPKNTVSGPMQVGVGLYHQCVLKPGQGVWCWGDTHAGQTGHPPAPPGSSPEALWDAQPQFVPGTERAAVLSVGDWHACVVAEQGEVRCWGSNEQQRLGVSSPETQTCWDSSYDGGVTYFPCEPEPRLVPGVPPAEFVVAGPEASCIGASDNSTHCMGRGRVDVSSAEQAVDISLNSLNGCAVLRDGSIKCVGDGGLYQRAAFDELPPLKQVALGNDFACVVDTNAQVLCWGSSNSSGQLGAGHTDIVNPWETTRPIAHIVDLVAAVSHTCARNEAGEVWCWGRNAWGQIGRPPGVPDTGGSEENTGDNPSSGSCPGGPCVSSPAKIESLPPASQIAVGGLTSCAIANAKVYCWGQAVDSPTPVEIDGPWVD